MAVTCLSPRSSASQSMAKSCSGRTDPSFGGRSRTWPKLASTVYLSPRYLFIVLALAGDSTTTTSAIRFLDGQPILLGRRAAQPGCPAASARGRRVPAPAAPPNGGGRELAA